MEAELGELKATREEVLREIQGLAVQVEVKVEKEVRAAPERGAVREALLGGAEEMAADARGEERKSEL